MRAGLEVWKSSGYRLSEAIEGDMVAQEEVKSKNVSMSERLE